MVACSPDLCGWTADVPEGGRLRGQVWWCGDDYCDCTEPKVEHGTFDGRFWRWSQQWAGTFQTDGEGQNEPNEWKDAPMSSTELNRMAQHLRRHHHDLYSRVAWPWSSNASSPAA